MSDESVQDEGPEKQTPRAVALSFNDRVNVAVLGIFANRGMITDGKLDQDLVTDTIEPAILAAIVKVEADRGKVGVTPTQLMEKYFPEVLKRDQAQTDDEEELEFVDAVYGKTKAEVFRVLSIMPNGPLQSRLKTNGTRYELCRMKGKRGAEERAYITRNRKCIDMDNNQPALHAADLAIAKAAALTGLSIERVPEHGTWFHNRYTEAVKQLTDAGADEVRAALEVSKDDAEVQDDAEEQAA